MKTRYLLFIFIGLIIFSQILSGHGWKAPDNAASIKNPVALTLDSQKKGEKIYLNSCAGCHGKRASGVSKEDTGLPMDTPNLKERLSGHSDGDFFWKIQNGKGRMPSFREDFSDEDIWNVINYIKGLEKN